MIPDIVRIRDAELQDVDALYNMGIVEEGFAVSSRSRFYFCRVNRNDWAMLENIAVSASVRIC